MKTTTLSSLFRSAGFATAALLLTVGPARATDPSDASIAGAKLSHGDRTFFEKAAKGGMKEVAVSEAVMDRLNNSQVRDFAKSMVNDHTDVNRALLDLATRKGVTLPVADPKAGEKWGRMEKNADKAYVNQMVDDHDDAVKLFEHASKSDDADVAAFAQKTLPALRHHLMMAKDLKQLPL